jgi:hypothetical protein
VSRHSGITYVLQGKGYKNLPKVMNWRNMKAITVVPEHAVDERDGLLHLGDQVEVPPFL